MHDPDNDLILKYSLTLSSMLKSRRPLVFTRINDRDDAYEQKNLRPDLVRSSYTPELWHTCARMICVVSYKNTHFQT